MDEWYHPTATGHQEESKLLRDVPVPGRPTSAAAGSLDMVFVIDTTGSMSSLIDQVKACTTAMVSLLQSSTGSYRFALVTYRDDPTWTGDPDDYAARVDLPFTTDAETIRAALATMTANGGGDWEETALSGLDTAISLPWRPGVKKVAVVMGDSPAHNPEPVSGLSSADVIAHSLAVDPVEVFTLSVSGTSLGDSLTDVVDRTGGQLVTATGDVAATLTTTITGALDKPYAWLDDPWTAKVGTTLTLDARGSYAPVGTLVSYAWDLNSDGTPDVTTATPTLEHLFDTTGNTVVSVQVTDDAGRSSAASTRVTITDDGDDIPAASDTCPEVADPAQTDSDGVGLGDACDTTPPPVPPATELTVFGPDELASVSTASLSGTITDSSGPVAGAAVTIAGTDAGGQPASATATSTTDGTWQTPGLLPGTYSLTAAGASTARVGTLSAGAGDGSSAGAPDGATVRSIVLSGIGTSATGYVFTIAAVPGATPTTPATPTADPTATSVAALIAGTPASPTALVAGRAPTALSATGFGGLIPLAVTSGGLLLLGLLARTVALCGTGDDRKADMRGRTLLTATLLAGLLSGCSTSSAELDLLRADPMATAKPAGLTSQSVSEDAGGTTLGKDTPSYVLRRLHLAHPADALVELDHAAQGAGWVARVPLDLTVTPVAAFYKRTADGLPLELTLTWDGTDEVVVDLSTP